MAHQQKWLSGRVNGFTPGTLENNWNEERFDIKYLKQSQPLPSQFGHFYTTTYKDLCSNQPNMGNASEDAVNASKHRTPGFPGHQPELDPEYHKSRLNTYETDQRVNYLDPRLKKFPFDLKQMISNEVRVKEEATGRGPQSINEPQKVNTTSAPIVQLEKVFSEDPHNRIFKAASDIKPSQAISQPPIAPAASEPSPVISKQSKKEEEHEDLSNFDKLMITINRKKSARAAQKQQQEVIEPVIDNSQNQKQSKSVHWNDQ